MPKAEVSIDIEEGSTSYGGTIRKSYEAKGVDVQFKSAFCSKHPSEDRWGSYGSDYTCQKCDDQARELARDVFLGEIINAKLDCKQLLHDHDCRCWKGHDCDTDVCTPHRRVEASVRDAQGNLLMDDKGNALKPNPMMVLAAEGPNPDVLSMVQRLAKVEKENQDLKLLLRRLMEKLPESVREAVGCPEVLSREESDHPR